MCVFTGYESGFESHAFAGELEFDELDIYFRECDLYPAQSDVEEAIDLVFRGKTSPSALRPVFWGLDQSFLGKTCL